MLDVLQAPPEEQQGHVLICSTRKILLPLTKNISLLSCQVCMQTDKDHSVNPHFFLFFLQTPYFGPVPLRRSLLVPCMKVFSPQTECYRLFWILIKVTGIEERTKGDPVTPSTTKQKFGKEVSLEGKRRCASDCMSAQLYIPMWEWGRVCVDM